MHVNIMCKPQHLVAVALSMSFPSSDCNDSPPASALVLLALIVESFGFGDRFVQRVAGQFWDKWPGLFLSLRVLWF